MKPEEYSERRVEIEGWPINLTTYRLGEVFHSKADNVSPGAWLARAEASTRDAAEEKVLTRARQLLSRTRHA